MAKRQMVSTLTHTSREVAEDFLRWREEQKHKSMIGHNGCPLDEDDEIEEAYKILNLDPKKKYSKKEIMISYKKIMKKIHPDISPELTRLSSIVNEAKETVLKNLG